MFCTRCGAQIGEGNRFCQVCGQAAGAAAVVAGQSAVAAPIAPLPPLAVSSPVYAPPAAAALLYAGFWVRFAAYLVDGVILGIPFGAIVIALIFAYGGFGALMHHNGPIDPRELPMILGPMFLMFWMAMLVFLGVQWLYFAGLESSERQATIGKSVMSIRVTNAEGRRLSFGHATGRFFAKIVSGLIPLGIGYIMAAFTERKQALHDLIAGTLVLKS